MPFSLDPDAVAPVFLESDNAKPEAERPAFLIKFLTCRELDRWRELRARADASNATEKAALRKRYSDQLDALKAEYAAVSEPDAEAKRYAIESKVAAVQDEAMAEIRRHDDADLLKRRRLRHDCLMVGLRGWRNMGRPYPTSPDEIREALTDLLTDPELIELVDEAPMQVRLSEADRRGFLSPSRSAGANSATTTTATAAPVPSEKPAP